VEDGIAPDVRSDAAFVVPPVDVSAETSASNTASAGAPRRSRFTDGSIGDERSDRSPAPCTGRRRLSDGGDATAGRWPESAAGATSTALTGSVRATLTFGGRRAPASRLSSRIAAVGRCSSRATTSDSNRGAAAGCGRVESAGTSTGEAAGSNDGSAGRTSRCPADGCTPTAGCTIGTRGDSTEPTSGTRRGCGSTDGMRREPVTGSTSTTCSGSAARSADETRPDSTGGSTRRTSRTWASASVIAACRCSAAGSAGAACRATAAIFVERIGRDSTGRSTVGTCRASTSRSSGATSRGSRSASADAAYPASAATSRDDPREAATAASTTGK
jgi:hypothetical protein